jgi:hypothetical protein
MILEEAELQRFLDAHAKLIDILAKMGNVLG